MINWKPFSTAPKDQKQVDVLRSHIADLRGALEGLQKRLKCGVKEHRVLRSPLCGDCQALAMIEAALALTPAPAQSQDNIKLNKIDHFQDDMRRG